MGKLDGKVAIVTGAARGLGRAYARRLAGLGAKVAVTDLNLRSFEEFEAEAQAMTAESTVAEIQASGGSAMGIEVDVCDEKAVAAMVQRVSDEWGCVDILVCNAGGGRGRPVDTKASALDPGLLQLVTSMNLYGTVYCCNAVAPIMKRQRSGKIITVSSVAGLRLRPMAAMRTMVPPRRRSHTTPGIWRRILGRMASRRTVSPRAPSPPGASSPPSCPAVRTPIVTEPNALPCAGSGPSRTAPRSWSFLRLTCRTMSRAW